LLTDWPLSEPRNWAEIVNQPQTEAEVNAIRRSILRGCPYGNDDWVQRTAPSLGLESTLRPRGRPKVMQEQ
jgi:putative transposase